MFFYYFFLINFILYISGIFATIVGLIILLMDTKKPQAIQKFFLIEVHDDTEEAYETQKNSASSNTPIYKKVWYITDSHEGIG
jgi:sugar phosphate permease